MKTTILSLFLGFGLVCELSAQGFYVKLGGGYALPASSQNLLEQVDSDIQTGNATTITTSTRAVKGSYGAGIMISGSAGYKFSPFIGVDLGFSYLLGKEYKGSSSASDGSASYIIDQTTRSKGFFISPSLLFMAGTGKVRPYAIVGIAVGKVDFTDETSLFLDTGDEPTTAYLEEKTTGKLAFGARGGIGVDLSLSDRITLYGEGIFNTINFYAKEKEYTTYIVDNEDVLGELLPYQKKVVYKESITERTVDGNTQINEDEPSQELRTPLPLSGLSFNVGVKVKFGWE